MSLITSCKKVVTFLLVLLCLAYAAIQKPQQISAQTVGNINKAWASTYLAPAYKEWIRRYVQPTGMVYAYDWSHSNYGITGHPNSALSEGQSYAMTMSVYMNDQATFDRVWQWTKAHMQVRPADKLFYWWTGSKPDGTYGPLVNDTAADGDEFIAYALMKAGQRWNRADYIQQGVQIANDIWNKEVVQSPANGKHYIGTTVTGPVQYLTNMSVNASYHMPYVFWLFSKYDTAHSAGWLKLMTDSYDTLTQCSKLHADNLTPDFFLVNMKTGVFSRSAHPNFGTDAERVFWHTSLPAINGDMTAQAFLKNHPFLVQYLTKYQQLPYSFLATGQPSGGFSASMTMLGLAQMNILEPANVKSYYDKIFVPRQQSNNGLWDGSLSYFNPAVTWFALYSIASG